MIKPKIPVEVAIFLRKSHRIAEDKRKRNSKKECRKFKKIWRKYYGNSNNFY